MSPPPTLGRAPLPLLPRPRTLARRLSGGPSTGFPRPVIDELATWSDLSLDSPTPVGGSSRGDNVIADTLTGQVLLKRYKATVTTSMIEQEHSVLRHLEACSFPAPRLVGAADGRTHIELAGRKYAIFVYEAGYFHYHEYVWPRSMYLRFVSQSGRTLGALHEALDAFIPAGSNPLGIDASTGKRNRDISWHVERLNQASLASSRSGSLGELRTMLSGPAATIDSRLRRLEEQLAGADLPTNTIHGDYGPYNVMFKRGEPAFVVDFEMARTDWRIIDVAKALQQFGLTRRGPRFERMASFLTGYRTQLTPTPDELALLPLAWEYLSVRRAIVCMFEFSRSRRIERLNEATQKLELAAMIRAASKQLVELSTGNQMGFADRRN